MAEVDTVFQKNAQLSKSWPVITKKKEQLPTATEFEKVKNKRALLSTKGA